jgi:hypothetical protein
MKRCLGKTFAMFLGSIALEAIVQAVLCGFVYHSAQQSLSSPPDLVAYYTGGPNPAVALKPWSKSPTGPKLLLSGVGMGEAWLRKSYAMGPDRLLIESEARTTDQNARYSAPMIRDSGAKQMLLVLPWYQMPRALFLTRFYLWGSGVKVTPYLISPPPKNWVLDNHFLWELVKFWGSLARIGLSWVGIEDWPPHFGYGKFD